MQTPKKNNKTWIAGLLTAATASLCCIAPVVALLGGAGGMASSFSGIDQYRPYLIGFTILVFAFAWYQKLKPQKNLDCACEADGKPSFFQSKSFLGIITIFSALLITFPYYAKVFYPAPKQVQLKPVNQNFIETATYKIEGMTCEACTEHVNNEISKLNGIIEKQTSYENALSTVKFDRREISANNIAQAINKTGYNVSRTITDH